MKPDPGNSRGIKRIGRDTGAGEINVLWIDRARVFQSAMSRLTTDYGTVDLSINDLTPEGAATGPAEPPPNYPTDKPKNYCERQGRCNIGCLPGASHTLNKQLVTASLGLYNPDTQKDEPGTFDGILAIQPLAEVERIEALPDGRYQVHYLRRQPDKPSK